MSICWCFNPSSPKGDYNNPPTVFQKRRRLKIAPRVFKFNVAPQNRTYHISQYLDTILAPLVTDLPTYIKDSPHALRLLQDFSFPAVGDNFLFTMDIASLYTSIPHALSMEALTHYLDSRATKDPATETLFRLLDLVLSMNTFQFNGHHYKQVKGIAMGAKIGPSVAYLTVGYIEDRMLEEYNHRHPIFFKRYIDDVLGAFCGSEQDLLDFISHVSNYHPCLKFTYEISRVSVVFLDLQLSINENHQISTSIHYKPTDSHSYLGFQSSHPPACKKGIPYSQLLRAKRICSDPNDFDRVCEDMTGFFHERGYPREITQSAQDRVKCLDRASTLQPSNPKSSERVPLVLTYHPLNLPIRNIIYKHFRLLLNEESTAEVFTQLPVTAFRRDRNIANHIVRASHPINPDTDPGTFSCNRSRCNTCHYVSSETHIIGPMDTFDITSHFTCTSRNVG